MNDIEPITYLFKQKFVRSQKIFITLRVCLPLGGFRGKGGFAPTMDPLSIVNGHIIRPPFLPFLHPHSYSIPRA